MENKVVGTCNNYGRIFCSAWDYEKEECSSYDCDCFIPLTEEAKLVQREWKKIEGNKNEG